MRMKKIVTALLSMSLAFNLSGWTNMVFAEEKRSVVIKKTYEKQGLAALEEPEFSLEEPQPTKIPEIVEGDYADIYIQAVEACGYTDATTFRRSFLALDCANPELGEADSERIRTHFQELGYTVYLMDYNGLAQQGLAVYEGEKLKLKNGVMIYMNGMWPRQEDEMGLKVNQSEVKGEDFYQDLRFKQEDDRWVFEAINYKNWYSAEPNPFEPILLGDTDESASIDLKDASSLLRMALHLEAVPEGRLFYLDLDGDSDISLKDASMCLRIGLNLEEKVYYGCWVPPK